MNPVQLSPLTVQVGLGGIWYTTLFIGIAIGVLKWVSTWPYFAVPFSAKLLWAYVLLRALYIVEYPAVHFGAFTTAYKAFAGQAMVETIFIPMTAIMFVKQIGKLIPYFAGFSIFCAWTGIFGLLGAPSFNSAFAAACMPFCPPWLSILTVITILTHHGTTAVLVVLAQLFAFLLKSRNWKTWALSIAFGAVLAFAAHKNSGTGFDSYGRIQEYKKIMTYWAYPVADPHFVGPVDLSLKNILVGVGPGSYMHTSLWLNEYRPPLFLQMHCDWLHILFVIGLVGFALALWVCYDAVKNAWKNPQLLRALFGCMAFALTYHPLQFFTSAILTAFVFILAFSTSYKSS